MELKLTRIEGRHVGNFDFGPEWRQEYKVMKKRTTAKVFVFPKGESIFENLLNRHARPHKLNAEVLAKDVESMLRESNLLPEGVPFKMSWSQKAGCSCGCSPGFIVKGTTTGVDFYADVEENTAQ